MRGFRKLVTKPPVSKRYMRNIRISGGETILNRILCVLDNEQHRQTRLACLLLTDARAVVQLAE